MKKVMMIGYGAMAKYVASQLPEGVKVGWLVVSASKVETIQQDVGPDIQVIGKVQDVKGNPDLVIEMAGAKGLKMHGPDVLKKGWNLGVISMGAFTDDKFTESLKRIAKESGAQVYLLAGAIAGVDAIAAARIIGLDSVVYEGRKHPRSWAGSPAEEMCDLHNLKEATVFFNGTAREAASTFPTNANVAATLAMAGVGLDDTQVQLVADPDIDRNQHSIKAQGKFGELSVQVRGVTLPDNPKTSALAALSVTRLLRNQEAVLVV